ncbi:MAG TPA: 1,4-alpha-glucan branching protein GlgB [Candidatus Dormibacteraeota bacterium]|nr:1,4-alpha-glucan branching protein GlgB [Candidatus Dormibacteraeota bacterium]
MTPTGPPGSREAVPRPPRAAWEALAAGTHTDPHRILGLHPWGTGSVVRVFRPAARQVAVLTGGQALPAAARRPTGLFEAALDMAPADAEYELEFTWPDGSRQRTADPYRLPPTLGPMDLHLMGEGTDRRLFDHLGAHPGLVAGVAGTAFAVWAPNATGVRLVGDFNAWDGSGHPLRNLQGSGVWELFVPGMAAGEAYKFAIRTGAGRWVLKGDPLAFATEVPPGTASRIASPQHRWDDARWLASRAHTDPLRAPLSIYEVHLGSWRRDPDGNRLLSYREIAPLLADYVLQLGFTHVEFLPVAEHPFGGSWGYQITGYYAPTARHGGPDDFRALVDHLHQRGIGVILDWVPAHFPRDEAGLAQFDGTALYEHQDPRQGSHPDWGTLIFNYGRTEVRNFLLANALFWFEAYHVDGLRVDAVASMLYLDYSRAAGEWVPNRFGGREHLEAVDFLRELNVLVHAQHPGALVIAEESTSWPGVSRPTYVGGLGFTFKWNMGWMHDTLEYFRHDPVHRRYHHQHLIFGLLYAWSENFILPLSHDEVVHGKGSLLGKMPGDRWQQLANLRALLAYMWAHPGKQLLFMGGEFAQEREWNADTSLDWHLLQQPGHRGVQDLVRDLNGLYRSLDALHSRDVDADGFRWIVANDADSDVVAFLRQGSDPARPLICCCNLSPIPRPGYRIGVPLKGQYLERLNTDSHHYGGSNVGNQGTLHARPDPLHGFPHSLTITLPPLATVWLTPDPH